MERKLWNFQGDSGCYECRSVCRNLRMEAFKYFSLRKTSHQTIRGASKNGECVWEFRAGLYSQGRWPSHSLPPSAVHPSVAFSLLGNSDAPEHLLREGSRPAVYAPSCPCSHSVLCIWGLQAWCWLPLSFLGFDNGRGQGVSHCDKLDSGPSAASLPCIFKW